MTNEEKILFLFETVKNLKSDISDLNKTVEQLNNEAQDVRKCFQKISDNFNIITKEKSLTYIFSIWFLAVMSMFVLGYMFSFMSETYREVIERMSSWATVGAIGFIGVKAGLYLSKINRMICALASTAFASIFICYIAYVFVDFGSILPHIAAIGFNIATVLQVLATYIVVRYVVKNK